MRGVSADQVHSGVYNSNRPAKNALEKEWIDNAREKVDNASDLELFQKTFDRMK
jgi:hypothetical protein